VANRYAGKGQGKSNETIDRPDGLTRHYSAATPAVGAVIALLNNERFKKGKPAMGFLNPWLYSKGYAGFTE
jgi:tripeptidyl-peptidase-1